MGEVATYVATRLAQIVASATPPVAKPTTVHAPVIAAVKAIIESKPRTPPHVGTKSRENKPIDSKPAPKQKQPQEKTVEAKPKDAPKKAIKKKVIKQKPKTENIFTSVNNIEGVHLDIYNFFDISPSIADASEIEKMQTVHQWAFGKNTDSKKALKKLVDLELKIGRSAIGSNKLNQLWNWIKIRELT